MTKPRTKPKHDFTPATNKTACENADVFADSTCRLAKLMHGTDDQVQQCAHETFMIAMNGAGMVQSFMNERKGKY